MAIHSIDAEDDQFAYRYDTQLLIERRDEDLDEDEISDYKSISIQMSHGKFWNTAIQLAKSLTLS